MLPYIKPEDKDKATENLILFGEVIVDQDGNVINPCEIKVENED